jgi:hypothetical protein
MPAKSKKQKNFMGMVHAVQEGAKIKNASPAVKKAAKNMSKEEVKKFTKSPVVKKKKKKKVAHFGDTF